MALDLSKHSMLIVDDVREMRTSLRAIAKSMGAESIYLAKSGAEAIELLQAHDISIVLCDYYLGDGRDGQQVFEEAKEHGMIEPTTVFVMITADNTMDVVMAVVEHQPDGYLIKPLNKSVLEMRLEKILLRKRVFRDIEATMRAGDFGKAAAICDVMLENHPKLRFDLLRLKAEVLLAAGANDQVEALCDSILIEREVPWAAVCLGRARYQAGNIDGARALFKGVIENNDAPMDAYDWLTRIDREAGDPLTAQKTLEQAVKRSPKSIGRQQVLADVATDNGDFATARKAFQAAVDLGEFSVYARTDDEVGLVNAVAEIDGPEEALKVLDEINHSRRPHGGNQATVGWRIELTYGQMLLANEEAVKAKESIAKALHAYLDEQRDSADPAALALAKCCYRVGMIPEAKDMMNRIVKENHDREDIISAVRLMYSELGMQDLGEDLIDSARRAVVDINNRGVSLAKEGKLDEAITLLTKASDELPGNLTISLNVLQAALSQIRFSGHTAERQDVLEQYVSRAERINADHPKLVKLREKIQLLQQDSEHRMQA